MKTKNRAYKTNAFLISLCTLLILTSTHGAALGQASSDALSDANRLLEVSRTADHFEAVARQQASDIIRGYTLIISSSTDVTLPRELRDHIAQCYARVYDWDNFKSGIANILANTLSRKQIQLLTDFYRSLGLPPTEIDTFEETIAMAGKIERVTAEFIYANSTGCVEQDTRLILSYLREHPDITPLQVEQSD